MSPSTRHLVLSLFVVSLLGCASAGDEPAKPSRPSPSEAGFGGPLLGAICPDDMALTPVVADNGPHATQAACEAARAAATPCGTLAVASPNATCNAYCRRNWWPCVGSVINPATIVGQACYPKPDGNYYYTCVATADCHCV
ncbi:MAG TPA: hypothetical protein VM557_12115 [Thermoanaerobaculia bacterium]|nr:hypothetical protein [Thermoanaerobaculia bacterium]